MMCLMKHVLQLSCLALLPNAALGHSYLLHKCYEMLLRTQDLLGRLILQLFCYYLLDGTSIRCRDGVLPLRIVISSSFSNRCSLLVWFYTIYNYENSTIRRIIIGCA